MILSLFHWLIGNAVPKKTRLASTLHTAALAPQSFNVREPNAYWACIMPPKIVMPKPFVCPLWSARQMIANHYPLPKCVMHDMGYTVY